MKIQLSTSEKKNHTCQICGKSADFLAVRKVAGNAFFCNRCAR